MAQWHFKFNGVNDFDDLVRTCLERIPQYNQVYPAAKSNVSASLEDMINKRSDDDQMSYNTHSNLDDQDEKCVLGIDLNAEDINNEQSSPTTDRIH
ncbi:unnamed protein product, partial [Rotaria sp. Silwood1]